MRAFCILRELFRAGVRAPAIFRGRHSSSSDEYGEWDEENKPYCPLQGGGGYDVSYWANPPFNPHRNIYHWLQTAADHQMYVGGDPQQGYRTWYYFEDMKNSPIQSKLLYNKAGFFVCALDELGDYYYLANANSGISDFQWRKVNLNGDPLLPLENDEYLEDGDYFQITDIKILTGFWSPVYDNYAAWRIP